MTDYHQYCLSCNAETVKRVKLDDRTYYHCSTCDVTNERSLVIDPQIVWWKDKEGNYWHESVGVLVFNEDKMLMFKRTIFPFAVTIPSGHLDVGEDPYTAAKRELKEETRLKVASLDLLTVEPVEGDQCRRGANNHLWHLYKVDVKNPKVIINDEGGKPIWLNREDALKEDLVFPVRHFLNKGF